MRSEARRPGEINLDRFVETLDSRLRDEVRSARRLVLPKSLQLIIRAMKIRAMALLQGGAMALTAMAVLVAVGFAPTVANTATTVAQGPLAAPQVSTDSALFLKNDPVILAFGSPVQTVIARGNAR